MAGSATVLLFYCHSYQLSLTMLWLEVQLFSILIVNHVVAEGAIVLHTICTYCQPYRGWRCNCSVVTKLCCGWSCKGYKEPQASANQKPCRSNVLCAGFKLSDSNTTKLAVSAVYWLKLATLYWFTSYSYWAKSHCSPTPSSLPRRISKHSVDHNHHCLDWNRIHNNYLHEFQSVLLGSW